MTLACEVNNGVFLEANSDEWVRRLGMRKDKGDGGIEWMIPYHHQCIVAG